MKFYKYTGKITKEIERGLEKLKELFEKVEKNIGVDGIEYIFYHDTFYGYKILHILQVSDDGIFVNQSINENNKIKNSEIKNKKECWKQFLDKINKIEELRDKIK